MACLVHGAHVLQTHNHIPSHVFGKHAKGFGHRLYLVELRRVFAIGYAQQQAAVIFLEAEHGEIARRWHQRTVVIVDGAVEHIVVAIGLTAGFKQPHLVGEALTAEYCNGIFGDSFAAVERHVGIHNLAHSACYAGHIVGLGCAAVGFAEVAEIAARNGVLHIQAAVRENVLARLVEHKAQRTNVGAHASPCAYVQELHVAALINPELKPLRRVVHSCRHRRVRKIEFRKSFEHVQQRCALGKTACDVDVFAAYFNHIAVNSRNIF